MNQIKYSHNWNNKLNCDVYTSIRKSTPEKKEYYKSNIGNVFDVILNGKLFNQKILWDVFDHEFGSLPLSLITLDTGFSPIDAKELFATFGIKNPEDGVLVLWWRNI